MKRVSKAGIFFLCITAAAGGVFPSARADSLLIGPVKDAMIFGKKPNPVPPNLTASQYLDTNNASGSGPAFFAGADGQGNIKRALIQFDVSSIPSNAIITGATMTLYLAQVAGSAGSSSTVSNAIDRQFGLYPLLQNWGEGPSAAQTLPNQGVGGTGQGAAEQNGDSTWDYAFYNTNAGSAVKWDAGSGAIHGSNFSPVQSAFLDIPIGYSLVNNAPFSWTSAGMVADIQSWVNGASNNGWLLKSENLELTPTSFLGFWSKDSLPLNSGLGAVAPSLQITYLLPVPEPGSLAVLALAIPFLLPASRKSFVKVAA